MTITLTPTPAGAVAISVSAGPTITALTRTDANGSASVRLPAGVLPSATGVAVVDYEAALTGPVTYTATATTGAPPPATTQLPAIGPRLMLPIAPLYTVPIAQINGYTAARESLTVLHAVIGRPDPLANLGPLGRRRGVLDVHCHDYAAASAVVALYARAQVVLLRQPTYAGLDLYHVATSVGEIIQDERTSPRRWVVSITYAEVARPAGPVQGTLGWDFNAVTASAPDFDTLAAMWADFNGLTIGPLT